MQKTSDRDAFILALHDELPDVKNSILCEIAGQLIRHERALSRINENECNRELSDAERKREKSIQSKVLALLDYASIKVDFNGDPRGTAIKLKLTRTKKYNSWDGESYCVPDA